MNTPHSSQLHDPSHELFRVLHIVEDPRTAFWFFRSLHEQAESQFALTSIADIQQAIQQLGTKQFDAVFLHVDSLIQQRLSDITQLRQAANEILIIAIANNATANELEALKTAGVDQNIRFNDLNTPLLANLVISAIERKNVDLKLAEASQKDATTGLCNRKEFMRQLNQELSCAQKSERISAILLLDLDEFKNINETQGHSSGDEFLREIAHRLQKAIRQDDAIARAGGDEFVVLLRDMPDTDSIKRVANNLLKTIAQTVYIKDRMLFTTASIGIAVYEPKLDADALLQHADIAMYNAKHHGGNRIAFFTRDQAVAVNLRTSLEHQLYKAIENEDFVLTFQPQIDATTRSLYGAEVLLRWNHPEFGRLSPGEFIPTLESTGLIAPATEWVIYAAIAQWRQLQEQKVVARDCNLSINLSPKYLCHPNLEGTLTQLSYLSEETKRHIHFEITENLFVDPDNNINNLKLIKQCGFKLSMDDFGTGYSSLSYLKHFPLDCIKLDRAFTLNITSNKIDRAITRAVINLSQDLGIDLIAEGVEDQATLEQLTSMGCRLIQGYYFSKPLSFHNFQLYCSKLKM